MLPTHSSTVQCAEFVAIHDHSWAAVGAPVAEHKRDGPTTCLTFLGIEVDTQAGTLRLPTDKFCRLQALLSDWDNRKDCSCREQESLIVLLNHICKVIRSGWSFLRMMIDLLHTVPMHPMRPHPFCLNRVQLEFGVVEALHILSGLEYLSSCHLRSSL